MILCCRIPDIPIAALVLRHDDASLHHRPLVVGGYPSERRPVQAATAEARSFGVCVGMPLRQAEQLCPEALFFPADPEAEATLARHLLAGLYALAPKVELSPGGEAYIDVDGLGDPVSFAARVAGYLEQRLKTRPALGIGSNMFVAFTAAGLGRTDSGAIAAGATSVPEPLLVPRGSERSFLAPLSIADHLPVDPELITRLKLFGLRRLGDLAQMPLAAVETQFGTEGLRALRLARGEDPRRLIPWEPPQRMEELSRLDPAVDNLTPLLFVARGLIDRLGTRLLEGGYAATVVRLRLELEDVSPAPEVSLRLRAPMSSGNDLWIPVSGLIQRQRIDRPVSGLRLRVSGFCPAGSRQMDLLARRDGRLEDIIRQLVMLAEAHGPDLLRMPELVLAPPLIDERRHRWTDPVEGLARHLDSPSKRRRGVAVPSRAPAPRRAAAASIA